MRHALVLGALGAVLAGSLLHTPPAQAAAAKPRTAESIACSKEADAKGLHGKERKTFRAKCKKDAKKARGAPAKGA